MRRFVSCFLPHICLLMTGVLLIASSGIAQTPQERAEVRTLLENWQKSNLIAESELDKLKQQGKNALPLLAEFLPDKDLGLYAEMAMQQIDSVGATPYLLKNLPRKDGNSQRFLFRAANRSIQEHAWFQRQSDAEKQRSLQPARYPRNTNPYPYTKELCATAREVVEADAHTGAEAEAMLTLGLIGDKRDIPLLKKRLAQNPMNQNCVSSLARLGDKETLDTLAQELEKPAKIHPAEAYMTDHGARVEPKPGALVTDTQDGQRLRLAMTSVAFSLNRRFVPLLIKHLDDPPAQLHGDYLDPSPAQEAQAALSQIVEGREAPSLKEDWKQWWREHQKEYNK